MVRITKYANWEIINADCMRYLRENWNKDQKIDLIIADPPFGIKFKTNNGFYNRKKKFVVGKYHEVSQKNYQLFTAEWLELANNVLTDNGLLWVVSGWTNDYIIKHWANVYGLTLVNEVIWFHNFATWNKSKFISSHYVLSLFAKNPKKYQFNPSSRFKIVPGKGKNKQNYADRLSVWQIKKDYRRGKEKTPNMLPYKLIEKMLQYTTKKKQTILDMFMGSGIAGIVAYDLGLNYFGIEIDSKIYDFASRFLLANTTSDEDIAYQNSFLKLLDSLAEGKA